MTNILDKLAKMQEAWQAQCNKPIDIDPDKLLKESRLERRMLFWFDIGIALFFLCMAVYFAGVAFWKDIHEFWPSLISAAGSAWVTGYILFNLWLRSREAAHYDESVLAHVERSINDIEHRMWLDRYSFWWYILPIALGCMLPPVCFFVMQYRKGPLAGPLTGMLVSELLFAVIIFFVNWTMKYAQGMGLEARRRKLEALRALRETLLNGESGN